MPINQQNQVESPVQKYLKWKGGEGKFVYWDKDAEVDVEVPEVEFIVLDELSTVAGFSEKYGKPIRANEVRSLRTQKLYVTAGGKELVSGYYSEIKDNIKAAGGKYASACYVLLKRDKEWELDLITMSGAAVSAWFDTNKEINTNIMGVKLKGKKEEKKGATKFFVPVFEAFNITPEVMDIAQEENKRLQEFLTQRSNEKPEEKPLTQAQALNNGEDFAPEDIEDKPIDLSEIPF